MATPSTEHSEPSWQTWSEAARVVLHPRHLRNTLTIALIVGTVLFVINQLDVVLRGDATAAVWVKGAITYLVPFCVANAGILVATRRTDNQPADGRDRP